MAVRKYIFIVVFVALLTISYFYLINKYNSNAIEFSFAGQLSKADINNLRKSTKSLVKKSGSSKELACIVNYIGSYGDSKLIMTSGMDVLAYEVSLIKGRWIADGDIREAVLGEKAADKFFSNTDVLGQKVRLYGQEYKIVGVIKNSNEIYVSFDENSRIDWSKKNIKFIIEDDKRLQLYVELLESTLKGKGLQVTDVNIYKQEVYWYINIILAIAIYSLYKFFQKLWREIVISARKIYLSYKEQIRVIEWYKYILKNKNDITALLFKLIIDGIILFAALRCISLLHIPSSLIPSNLFSPSSYIEVVRINLQSYISRLENGISGIMLETHMINLLLIIYLGIAVVLNKKTSVKKD